MKQKELLNEVYAKIAEREFFSIINILKDFCGIHVSEYAIKSVLESEHQQLTHCYRHQGQTGLVEFLENNSFDKKGSHLVKIPKKGKEVSSSLIKSVVFDMFLFLIKAERRRLLEIYYRGGIDDLTQELKELQQ